VTGSDGAKLARLTDLVEWQRRELDRVRAIDAVRAVTDLATGMLMERLKCSAAEAGEQLARLSSEIGVPPAELAAEITGRQPLAAPEQPGVAASLGSAAARAAPDGARIAQALLDQALSTDGAAAVAIWLIAADGGLELAGEAGFGPQEASRWRRIPPAITVPAARAAHGNAEIWWPRGRPPGDDTPLIGGRPGWARAVLPLHRFGTSIGALEVCWPKATSGFPRPACRQLGALADMCAQALASDALDGAEATDYSSAWIFSLLDGLHECAFTARAIRDDHGTVTGLMIDWASQGFTDPAGHTAAEITGHHLLEIYPWAARPGDLYDRAMQVLNDGQPQHLPSVAITSGGGGYTAEVRIAALFDGVVITWRQAGEAERLATMLDQAQWLGRIGGWEEDLVAGEVTWAEPTFALFGQPPGSPLRLADLRERVPADDLPAVAAFRDRLVRQREATTAAFRVIRGDDNSVRHLRALAQPVTGPAGDLIAVRGAYQDISGQLNTQMAFDLTRQQLAGTEERAREEHQLAIRLQQAITPQASQLVEAAGLEVAARYRPSGPGHMVSGDWYDAVLLPTKEVLIAVGDVAGHGLDAVTGMVALRNYLRGLAVTGAGPAALLGWLNSAAFHLADGVLGTAVCGIYDPGSRTLRWAQAGHLPPLLVRRKSARTLSPPDGMMLGADPHVTYQEATARLKPGDVLVLFTDGLIEGRGRPLDDALRSLTQLASRPVADVGTFADDLLAGSASDTGDDACLVAVSIR